MNLGAPGLPIETWETANLHGRNTRQPAKLPGAYRASTEARYQVRIESGAAISEQAALQKRLSRGADKDEGYRVGGNFRLGGDPSGNSRRPVEAID